MGIQGGDFRAYSSCFMHVIVAHMRLPFFRNIFNFFYIFSKIFKYFAFFALSGIYNNLVSQFRDFIYLLDKRSLLMKSFPILLTYLKICLWSVSYTPVMFPSQWHYWSPLLHKGCPWYKIPSHSIFRSWDTSVWGKVYEFFFRILSASSIIIEVIRTVLNF